MPTSNCFRASGAKSANQWKGVNWSNLSMREIQGRDLLERPPSFANGGLLIGLRSKMHEGVWEFLTAISIIPAELKIQIGTDAWVPSSRAQTGRFLVPGSESVQVRWDISPGLAMLHLGGAWGNSRNSHKNQGTHYFLKKPLHFRPRFICLWVQVEHLFAVFRQVHHGPSATAFKSGSHLPMVIACGSAYVGSSIPEEMHQEGPV